MRARVDAIEGGWCGCWGGDRRAGAAVSQVDVLDAAEREQLLSGWNDTAAEVPEITLPEMIAGQAARVPDAVAVLRRTEHVSYAELEARAGLTGYLAGLGAGPETVVAVVMERSAGLVAALLGVLKAGAAYLPVDPGYPAVRIAYMLADRAGRWSSSAGCAAAVRGRRPAPVLGGDR